MVQDFVAYPSKWRIALLMFGGIGLFIASLWFIGAFGPPPQLRQLDPGLVTFFGWFGALFFGFGVFVMGRMMTDSEPHVRIDAKGIYWKRWSADTIPWSEITGVGVWGQGQNRCIVLKLLTPDRYTSTTLMGRLAGANRMLTDGDISITLLGTTGGFEDAMAAIERFRG
jgi:hypothetical protein